jgi:hypothetical protein
VVVGIKAPIATIATIATTEPLSPRLSTFKHLSLRLSLKAGARPQARAQSGMMSFTQLIRSLIS